MKVFLSTLTRALEIFLILAFALLTLDILWGVFTRYILGHQASWTEEIAIYLLIWISLLAAALTYKEMGHLGVDYLVRKLDPSAQKIADIFVQLVVIFFAATVLLYGGSLLVSQTLAANQLSPTLEWKVGYLYAAAPLSGICFIAFAIEHLSRIHLEDTQNRFDSRIKKINT